MFRITNIFLILILLMLAACQSSHPAKDVNAVDPGVVREPLLNANKKVVETEDEQIRNFINRYGWKMNETGTGLRYLVYKHGSGPKAEHGMIARLNYEIRLITGDLVYSSKESGPKEFQIGSGGVESGLEEGILLLRTGDKAKFIMPSHLAWGLIGDQDRIPPKSTLIYDVELIELKKGKIEH